MRLKVIKMNLPKKYKNPIASLLVLACLFLSVYFYQTFTLKNVPDSKLQASIPKVNFNEVAPIQKESFSKKPEKAKSPNHPVLSAREKYEAFLKAHPFNNKKLEEKEAQTEEAGKEGEKKPDRPDLAYQQDFLRTMNPVLKRPTPEVLTEIIKKNHPLSKNSGIRANRMPGDNSSLATNWTERGPNNVGGRTRAIAWDPYTDNKVWAGGVSGGLWYNNNITDANSAWVKADDFWSTLSITGIVFDPKNPKIAYVSTGEGYGVGASIGGGVWKTTNGGTSWSQLTSTQNMCYINDIAVRTELINNTPTGVIYVASDAGYYEGAWFYANDPRSMIGLYRSEDGGSAWTQVLPRIPSTGPPTIASSISISASNRIWLGTKSSPYSGADRGGGRVLYSDDGVTWNVSNTLTDASNGRVSIACAPSDSNYVYSFMENRKTDNTYGQGGVIILRKTTDNGATWVDIAQPDDADNAIPTDDFTRGQEIGRAHV